MKTAAFYAFGGVCIAALTLAVLILLGAAGWGCYPKECDPRTDPLKCQCPNGPCGDYPSKAPDGGRD